MFYIYNTPFVVDDTTINQNKFFSELTHLNEHSREDEKQIRALIFKFVVEYKLVSYRDGKLTNTHITDTGSWKWMINNLNFRSLVNIKNYSDFLSSLQSDDQYPITILIDLHCRLGMFFDPILLNDIVNRTLQSIKIIPWDSDNEDELISWNQIHRETPFLWVVILMQAIIRNELGKQL